MALLLIYFRRPTFAHAVQFVRYFRHHVDQELLGNLARLFSCRCYLRLKRSNRLWLSLSGRNLSVEIGYSRI